MEIGPPAGCTAPVDWTTVPTADLVTYARDGIAEAATELARRGDS